MTKAAEQGLVEAANQLKYDFPHSVFNKFRHSVFNTLLEKMKR
jgi:hypothetical protein